MKERQVEKKKRKTYIFRSTDKLRRPFIYKDLMRMEIEKSNIIKTMNPDKFLELVKEKNMEYYNRDLTFGEEEPTISMLNSAMKYDCYLGFDRKFCWLKEIEKNVNNSL